MFTTNNGSICDIEVAGIEERGKGQGARSVRRVCAIPVHVHDLRARHGVDLDDERARGSLDDDALLLDGDGLGGLRHGFPPCLLVELHHQQTNTARQHNRDHTR